MGPSKPVPVQSQEKLPGVFVQAPPFWHGAEVVHSFISETKFYEACQSAAPFPNFVEDLLKFRFPKLNSLTI